MLEIRNQNYEIRACIAPSLSNSITVCRNEILFPTVYEIGQPWPLVITSHHSGNHIFERPFRNLLQLISRISAPPVISRPFEVSDPLSCIDIGGYSARESSSFPLALLFFARGAKFGEQTRAVSKLGGETIIDTFECNFSRLEFTRLEFGIPRSAYRGAVPCKYSIRSYHSQVPLVNLDFTTESYEFR